MKILDTGYSAKNREQKLKLIDITVDLCKLFEKPKKSDFIWAFLSDTMSKHGRVPKK